MPKLMPVDTSVPGFTPAPITGAEGAAMFRACINLFRLWRLSDAEAAVLTDLPRSGRYRELWPGPTTLGFYRAKRTWSWDHQC